MMNVAVPMLYVILVANLQTSRCVTWPNFIELGPKSFDMRDIGCHS